MNTYGWLIMCISIGFVLTLVSWCYYKVLTLPPLEDDQQL